MGLPQHRLPTRLHTHRLGSTNTNRHRPRSSLSNNSRHQHRERVRRPERRRGKPAIKGLLDRQNRPTRSRGLQPPPLRNSHSPRSPTRNALPPSVIIRSLTLTILLATAFEVQGPAASQPPILLRSRGTSIPRRAGSPRNP